MQKSMLLMQIEFKRVRTQYQEFLINILQIVLKNVKNSREIIYILYLKISLQELSHRHKTKLMNSAMVSHSCSNVHPGI